MGKIGFSVSVMVIVNIHSVKDAIVYHERLALVLSLLHLSISITLNMLMFTIKDWLQHFRYGNCQFPLL